MLDAARRLIDSKGDEFTTQELAAEAGVALQTFYRYFSSKDELLLAVIGDTMTDACEHWKEVGAELPDPLARLRYYITATLERLAVEVGLPAQEVRDVLAGDRYAAEVRDDERTAASFGISGVPFFVVDRSLAASGAQSPDILGELLSRGWSAPATAPEPADSPAAAQS